MSLQNVLDIQKKKNNKRKQLRQDIYDKIKNRIDYYARYGKTNCQYQIPNFIYGYPHLNTEATADEIVNMLKQEGFIVVKLDAQNIFISWEETVVKEYAKKMKKENQTPPLDTDLNPEDQKLLRAISKLGF